MINSIDLPACFLLCGFHRVFPVNIYKVFGLMKGKKNGKASKKESAWRGW